MRSLHCWTLVALLSLLLLVAACGGAGNGSEEESGADPAGTIEAALTADPLEPAGPAVNLSLGVEDVSVEPLPLRAGFPFTVTAIVHNNADLVAEDVPVMVYISADQERLGYTSFMELFTVTVPASQSLPVDVGVDWNFAGGDHRLWVQVNRLPDAWQSRTPTRREGNTADNIALLDLMIDRFDAYTSDLCSGHVDVELGPGDVLAEPDRQRVLVRVHNVGNLAVYNLPVVVTGDRLAGIAYTSVIPPCGGTAEVYVQVDRPFEEGEPLSVQVNPGDWMEGLEEDKTDNNQVSVTAGLAPEMVMPSVSDLEDYDFALSTDDIEIPEMWIALVKVRNLGTRDAANVPIRIENEDGRRILDFIPLVQGEGIGVAAMRVGYLWIPGGALTFTVNPEDVEGSYPEPNRNNNVAVFILP